MITHPSTDNPDVHHEESDVDIAAILKFGAGLFVLAVAIHLVIWGVLVFLDQRQAVTTMEFPMAAGETRTPPGPRLQVAPRQEMRQLRAADEETLSSYRWVDRDLGVVRIPIDVAIRLTLERGLPARGDAAPAEVEPSAPAAPSTGAPQP